MSFHPELFPVSSSAPGQRLTGGEDSVAMWIKSVVRGGLESQSFAKKPWCLFCFSHGCLELLQF